MKLSLFNSAVIAVIFAAQAAEAVRVGDSLSRDQAANTELLNTAQTFTESEECAKCEAEKAR